MLGEGISTTEHIDLKCSDPFFMSLIKTFNFRLHVPMSHPFKPRNPN